MTASLVNIQLDKKTTKCKPKDFMPDFLSIGQSKTDEQVQDDGKRMIERFKASGAFVDNRKDKTGD